MKVFAEKYRGFDWVELDLRKVNFLVGDNSSGKSSLIYLADAICKTDLNEVPKLNERLGVGEYDYFSPYFNYANVSFGYQVDKDGVSYSKIITVKRIKNDHPRVVQCTYFAEGVFISFRFRNRKIETSRGNYSEDGCNYLLSVHNSSRGFREVEDVSGIKITDPSLILTAYENEEKSFPRKIFRYAMGHILPGSRVVSPMRALPKQVYTFRRKFDVHGLHFASMWLDLADIKKWGGFDEIEKFGQESKLFDSIDVQRISNKIEGSPLVVTVEKHGKHLLLNQVGIGVSQVVPVLIDTLYASTMKDTIVLMQQPELHLHPIAQASLGSYLYEVSSFGLRPMIETHSSFLIDRFRADLRDGLTLVNREDGSDEEVDVESGDAAVEYEDDGASSLKSADVNILFCQNSDTGNSIARISILDSGEMSGDPEGYHKFFVDEMLRTMF